MKRIRWYFRSMARWFGAIRPSAMRVASERDRSLAIEVNHMSAALQIIADGVRCFHPEDPCPVDVLDESGTHSFVCASCLAALLLADNLQMVRVPFAPKLTAVSMSDGAIPFDPEFGSVICFRRKQAGSEAA